MSALLNAPYVNQTGPFAARSTQLPGPPRLGEDWEADRCTFVDVTMALWRLQEAVRVLAARVPPALGRAGEQPHRALFTAMPGDQHGFGTVVIDEVFRRGGWESERG